MSKRAKTLKFSMLRKHRLQLLRMLMTMFEYSDTGIKREFIEWPLLNLGHCAIAEKDGKYYSGYMSSFDQDENGLPGGAGTFSTRAGFTFEVVIGENCVIGYNDESRLPDLLVDEFAEYFTEIDTSIAMQVKKSRLCPIPLAQDEKIKKAMETILSDVEDGNTKIIAKPFSPASFDNEGEMVKMISFTEPDQIAKVQYLSQLYDDMLRRFWINYGMPLSGMNKRAQVNSEELDGYDSLCRINPYSMLTSRREMIDECNRVFGTNWTVDFSKAFEHLKKEVTAYDVEGIQTDAEDSAEESDTE